MTDFARKADEIMRGATNRALAKASHDLRAEVKAATPKGETGDASAGWVFNRRAEDVDFFRGEALSLENHIPYAVKLENGLSKQAPNGMLVPTLERLPGLVEAAAREERDRGE